MDVFEGYKGLADYIIATKPAGSFSSYVRMLYVEGQPSRKVEWIKGKVIHDIDGRFMTWAKTGGCVYSVR